MKTKVCLPVLALLLAATPAAAQIVVRDGGSARTGSTARGSIETVLDRVEAARTRAGIETGSREGRASTRNSRVPPGHLPPRGKCRVWVDGVPPGLQPSVTSCAQAERDAFGRANARVIYGDRESFPGKGKSRSDDERRGDDDDRWDDDDDGRRGNAVARAAKQRAKAAKKNGRGRG